MNINRLGKSKEWKSMHIGSRQTPSQKLIDRIKKKLLFPLSDKAEIIRTGASKDWRGSGRWQWMIKDPEYNCSIGSDTGVRELLKCKFLEIDFHAGGRILGMDYRY